MSIIIAIIVGGFAGFLAEKLMKSDMGIVQNVLLGMAGAFVAGIIFRFVGVSLGGVTGYLISGVAGACLLIFLSRGIKGRKSDDRQ